MHDACLKRKGLQHIHNDHKSKFGFKFEKKKRKIILMRMLLLKTNYWNIRFLHKYNNFFKNI